ncbi:hypothetical protein BDY21DRAFT_364282 [Lineolata rhizophorae]|uniref:Uncharacterized protein n=1 Tax=Lineolata rhizophorae TaxID=578093 RepID=A0A6A6NZP9_9PEZI|nr:hypothetical protein BDY21DRAFT_364282 [Lineolata rhizophorae]
MTREQKPLARLTDELPRKSKARAGAERRVPGGSAKITRATGPDAEPRQGQASSACRQPTGRKATLANVGSGAGRRSALVLEQIERLKTSEDAVRNYTRLCVRTTVPFGRQAAVERYVPKYAIRRLSGLRTEYQRATGEADDFLYFLAWSAKQTVP